MCWVCVVAVIHALGAAGTELEMTGEALAKLPSKLRRALQSKDQDKRREAMMEIGRRGFVNLVVLPEPSVLPSP